MAYDSTTDFFQVPVLAPFVGWDNYLVLQLDTREDASNVYVTASLRPAQNWGDSSYAQWNGDVFDWIMELKRAVPDVTWNTIGSRTGYISLTSNSNRTFTNVGGGALRVDMRLTNRKTGQTKLVGSKSFIRY